MQSFESTKSEIVASGLGTALGLAVSHTWAQIVATLKAVVNRGRMDWSGNNTYYDMPAGYYSGGRLDSRASYNNGYNAGVTAGKTENAKVYFNDAGGHNLVTAGSVAYTMSYDGILIITINVISDSRFAKISVLKNGSVSTRIISSCAKTVGIIGIAVRAGDAITIKINGTDQVFLTYAGQLY